MTDADAEGTPEQGATDGPADQGPGREERRPHAGRRRWLRWAAGGVSLALLVGSGVGWLLYQKLEGNITTDTDTAKLLEEFEQERPEPASHSASNILILGSDDRSGDNRRYGRDNGTARSDTAILLHLAADRRSATAVSIPRDLMVRIPSCNRPDGSSSKEQFAQFNWAFQFGGPACTIRTLEELTGVRVNHHVVIDFDGFKRLVDSVGGVEVCLSEPVNDPDAKLELPAGRQTLRGEDALGYVRARYTLGNGSDTDRMSRQQDFLASLVQKVRSNGILMNPAKLYPVLDAATSSVTADSGLNSLTELYDLVRSVRNIPTEDITFLTVPREPYVQNPNRDQLRQPAAEELFDRLREDRAVPGVLREDDPDGGATASGTPEAPAEPGDGTGEGTGEGTDETRDVCGDPR